MRHKVLLICILLCLTYKAIAQDFRYRHHDISISLGVLSIPFDTYGYGPDQKSFSAQYTYQLSKCVGLCVIANYSPVRDGGWEEERLQYIDEWNKPHYEFVQVSKKVGEYISIMPATRLSWVNKRHFNFYSKVAVGISYDTYESKTDLAVQFSPLGIVFGKSLYGVFEIGSGRQGLFVLGMGYKFK